MIDFLPSPDSVVAFRVRGTLSAEDVRRVTARIDERLETTDDPLGCYADLTDMNGVSAPALFEDLRYSLSHLTSLTRFSRMAVVSTKRWLQTIANWEGRFLPGVEIRSFTPAEDETAMEWVSTLPEPAPPAVRRLPTDREGVLAFAIDGAVGADDLRTIGRDLRSAYATHGTIRLLVRIDGRYAMRPDLLTENVLGVKREALKHVEAYAIVGGPDWLRSLADTLNPLFRMDVRAFPMTDEAQAWSWIGARPVEPSGMATAR